MKLTNEQLKQIIKEEIQEILSESDWDPTRMTKKEKDVLRGPKPTSSYENPNPGMTLHSMQAKIYINALDELSPEDGPLTADQGTIDAILKIRPDLEGRVVLKEI
jgi:hypothetical protein